MTDRRSIAAWFSAVEPRAADGLRLAAAPTFALMAFASGATGGARDMMCSTGHGTFSLSGMTPMYLLMSAFHLAPWLRLLSRGRS